MSLGPSLLDLLTSEEGEALRSHFHERTLSAGSLFAEEDGRDRVFVVKRGRLRAYLATEDRELSLTYLTDGDIFSTHTRARLQAVEQTKLLLADRQALERELADYPALRAAVIRVLARVLTDAISMIEDLAFHDVRGRIARYLLRLALRRDPHVEAGQIVRVDLSMEELAALLGSTRQTASTEFNAMIKAEMIARHGRRHLVLRDPVRLRALAAMDEASAR